MKLIIIHYSRFITVAGKMDRLALALTAKMRFQVFPNERYQIASIRLHRF